MEHKILKEMEVFLKVMDIPGMTACVVTGGQVMFNVAAGLADIESAVNMTPSCRMLSGSIGKTFTSAIALALEQKAILDIDSPISEWLGTYTWFPRLANGNTACLRNLLNHTSGIPDHRVAPAFAEILTRELPRNADLYLSPETLIGCVLDIPENFPMGSAYSYSETNYILAGLIIEKAAGQPFYTLIRDYFLSPLELSDTEPAIHRDLLHMAKGYSDDWGLGFPTVTLSNGRLTYNPASEWAGGGFVSTARDLARWGYDLYSGSALSAPYLSDLSTSNVIGEECGVKISYGLGCYLWKGLWGRAIGHGGEAPGYRSGLAYFEEMDMALALQINSSIITPIAVREFLFRLARAF